MAQMMPKNVGAIQNILCIKCAFTGVMNEYFSQDEWNKQCQNARHVSNLSHGNVTCCIFAPDGIISNC